ncbi:hypothetical protein SAMN00790413_02870 [Deinococcus hopiensis KR-140]|uniref:Uncharacterized protein n=1 Tax=Deinococcus hopiensis KR-140 TaxID=695939 RepID=A0A1W1VQK6_9DEIO|nr:hypothetical protein SAMN00790413_02870 [Deinococcus hopiensis KR-140]
MDARPFREHLRAAVPADSGCTRAATRTAQVIRARSGGLLTAREGTLSPRSGTRWRLRAWSSAQQEVGGCTRREDRLTGKERGEREKQVRAVGAVLGERDDAGRIAYAPTALGWGRRKGKTGRRCAQSCTGP